MRDNWVILNLCRIVNKINKTNKQINYFSSLLFFLLVAIAWLANICILMPFFIFSLFLRKSLIRSQPFQPRFLFWSLPLRNCLRVTQLLVPLLYLPLWTSFQDLNAGYDWHKNKHIMYSYFIFYWCDSLNGKIGMSNKTDLVLLLDSD